MSYFPMFIDLGGRKCLVIGGGKVASRKIRVLKDFGADVFVVAPDIIDEIKEIPHIQWEEREFQEKDLEAATLAVAATGDSNLNHKISILCQNMNIPVNAVDQIEDCDFIFPSYVKCGEVTGAFTSGGQSPVITQYLKQQTQTYLTEFIGELAESLGDIRPVVKKRTKSEGQRKKIYQEILQKGLEEVRLLKMEEIDKIIEKYSQESEEETWTEQGD
ncbi:siroheme synthase [Anaerostipes sp. 494a]|uniref:precorrin-2 dehydrogenase/sirohydrochlorin ferrochelatase family protein n=1 Tax=Anaerostipes sp. 494a TaxID=1261636 RepID=UPI0009518B73|nr:bifunctional precorrin-2 dehydrogenase/sirohydrochlorin ferrochelatase [Anaerostipes sp. 494a]OLR60007.1 siroheme synthase [Anaerostipes sp. 494a]